MDYDPGFAAGTFYQGCYVVDDVAALIRQKRAGNSVVRYRFSLRNAVSDALVALPSFYFSFFDLETATYTREKLWVYGSSETLLPADTAITATPGGTAGAS